MYDIDDLTIVVPGDVREILKTLHDAGYEAYIVGGCVRDAILGLEPKDWDITTSALPEQVKSLFSNTVDTGIQHGTVMVIKHGTGYEVTTYRIDGEYKDGRHPENVTFTRSLAEDLKRRDFTINAFAYSPEKGVVDMFEGLEDLDNRLIRCVGDPNARFSEDALRIMRAVRFSAQLSFKIETVTLAAIGRHVQNLSNVSMERIRVEFEKTLLSNRPEKVTQYASLGMGTMIVPDEALAKKCFDTEITEAYQRISGNEEEKKVLRLAAFFHNLTSEEVKRALKRMKYDNRTIKLVSGIIKYKDQNVTAEKSAVKRALHEQGEELFTLVLCYRETVLGIPADDIRTVLDIIKEANEPYEIAHLTVSGTDLIEAGIPKGELVGETLNMLLNQVIEDPGLNHKEVLLGLVNKQRG